MTTTTSPQAVRVPSSLLVVGAGLAGLGAARAARLGGFTGRVRVVGAERHRPYDRPPLSKDYLLGAIGPGDLGLEGSTEDLDTEWLLGRSATAFEASSRELTLSDGSRLSADAVVLATGSIARRLPDLAGCNVHTLRTLDDADRLRRALRPGAAVAIVGAGLIGSEVASTAIALGCSVTLLSNEANPLARTFGPDLGLAFLDWHREHDAEVVFASSVSGVTLGDEVVALTAVTATGLRRVPADLVVVAIGGVADLDWLAGSGLELADGLTCDERGLTNAPGVGAVGDCAAWWDPRLGAHLRSQHWNDALERPATLVSALLGLQIGRPRPYLPYLWSDQYGRRIQLAGYPALADDLAVDGDAGNPAAGFVAHYRRAGEPVGVLSVGRPREFTRWRKQLVADLGHLPAQVPAAG